MKTFRMVSVVIIIFFMFCYLGLMKDLSRNVTAAFTAWSVCDELRRLDRLLTVHCTAAGAYPQSQQEFRQLLETGARDSKRKVPKSDAWGTAFGYVPYPDGYAVWSCGSDRKGQSGDDYLLERHGDRVTCKSVGGGAWKFENFSRRLQNLTKKKRA